MKKTHYVAEIKVDRVDKETTVTKVYDVKLRKEVEQETQTGRDVTLVARLAFSAADTDSLAAKVAAHMGLIEDGETE